VTNRVHTNTRSAAAAAVVVVAAEITSIHFAGLDVWLNLPYTTVWFNTPWVAAWRCTQASTSP